MSVNALSPDLRRQVTLLSCAAFVSTGSARIADPLLPQIATEFDLSLATAAWAISAFALAYGLAIFFLGSLGDRYGKYRVISFAVLAAMLGGLMAALSPSFSWLVLGRILTGLTVAACIPLAMAWIGDKVPYEQRQPVLAYFLTGQLVGMIAGQLLGGMLADFVSWRAAFWFMLLAYAVVAALLFAERHHHADVDLIAADQTLSGLNRWQRLGSVWQSKRAKAILLTVNLEGAFVFGGLAMMPTYLNRHFGVSLTLAGMCVAVFGLGGFCYTTSARKLLTWFGERGLALGGGLLLGFSFFALAFAPHWYWAAPISLGVGMGYYMLHNTLQTNATQMAPAQRGTAVGVFASSLFAGQTMGVWLASIAADNLGFSSVFMAAAFALPLIGSLFAWLLPDR